MHMHQTDDTPDWVKVPRRKRNLWQHMAAETQGIGTPGNALSAAGFCLLAAGLWLVVTRSLWEGTMLVSAGRVADAIDGAIADRTGTKSPLGRALDAGLDKAGALLALLVFTLDGVLPLWVALAIAAQNLSNITISVYATWRHTFLNPSRAGKLSTAGFWLAIVAFVAARLLAGVIAPIWHSAALAAAYAVAGVAFSLGAFAAAGYAAVVRRSPPHRSRQDDGPATFTRCIVIRNPASTDAHKTEACIKELRRLLPESDMSIADTLPGGREANAGRLLQACSGQMDERTLLCVAGGDGTAAMVLNMLMAEPSLADAARRAPLLPLWTGNANDLACMLNGSPQRTSLRTVLQKGRVIAIHPLVCRLTHADDSTATQYIANYASFGASGFAMQKLEHSIRTRSPMRQPAVSRFGMELAEVSRLLMRAPSFRISEDGAEKVVFERVFLNGSRFAKIAAVPLRLTEPRFHRATVGRKSLWTLLFRLAELVRDRAGRRVGATRDAFTVLDAVWAQFDGEPVRIPAGTHVEITISDQAFYALSTKLKER